MLNRRIIAAAMMAVVLLPVSARHTIPFNDDWRFRFAHEVSAKGRRVDIPHTWNAQDALSGDPAYFRGMGVYQKKLDWNPEWEGQEVYLRFEGVNEVATVFVDDRFAGEHRGGYGAFVVPVSRFLTPGKSSTVTVKATNALNLDIMPLVGDFNMYGGIYRPVSIIAADPLHISLTDYASPGVYLTQKSVSRDRAEVEASVVVANRAKSDASGSVTVTVFDGDRELTSRTVPFDCAADTSTRVNAGIVIAKPHLWNGTADPFSYRVVATVADGTGRVTDEVTQPLGLRYYDVTADGGFSLNGSPLRLRGVCRHQDRAERGNALLPEHHREDAEIMREMGANAVRLAHYPQSSEFYSLMDSAGIVVWAEIPFIGPGGYHDRGFNDLPAFRANGEEQLREMIRQHYNHPSILFWGLFNELKTHGDSPEAYVARLDSIAHAEDPGRLTTAASFLGVSSPLSAITDLIAWNQYFGWYGGSPSDMGRWLDATHSERPELKIGISEYGAGASIYHQLDSVKPGESSGWWHPENYQTYYHQGNWKAIAERPWVWASFVWNLFDFGAAHRTEGDRPGINDKGLVTFDRKVKKDAFYFYKANWNTTDPFVYIASRRHNRRTADRTTVTLFSNLPEVELMVNGVSLGKRKSDGYGTFTFDDVQLRPGDNTIAARAAAGKRSAADTVTWTLIR